MTNKNKPIAGFLIETYFVDFLGKYHEDIYLRDEYQGNFDIFYKRKKLEAKINGKKITPFYEPNFNF